MLSEIATRWGIKQGKLAFDIWKFGRVLEMINSRYKCPVREISKSMLISRTGHLLATSPPVGVVVCAWLGIY